MSVGALWLKDNKLADLSMEGSREEFRCVNIQQPDVQLLQDHYLPGRSSLANYWTRLESS